MTTTLTFRLSSAQRSKLRRRAKQLGKSESHLLRELLDRELDQPTLGERLKGVAGSLSLKDMKWDPWRKTIYENNWRK